MNIIVICLIIAVLLPYLAKIPMVHAMRKDDGYDNHYPRAQEARLKGFGARATAAHQNSFEALAVFATAAITTLATQNVNELTEALSIAFILSRIVYHIFYLLDWASLRTTIWTFGFLCCLGMLGLCL